MIMFAPVYWFGWMIQPTLKGYFVYDRQDHRSRARDRFDTLDEAVNFIRGKL